MGDRNLDGPMATLWRADPRVLRKLPMVHSLLAIAPIDFSFEQSVNNSSWGTGKPNGPCPDPIVPSEWDSP